MNSILEMSWESAKSTLGGALNLKGGSKELKGPCPKCGGHDRFWIRQGSKLPVIFGCRAGCTFNQIIKELADRGLVSDEKLSQQQVYRFKVESPVPIHLYTWAKLVIDIAAQEGCEEDERPTLMKAAEYIDRAERRGILRD